MENLINYCNAANEEFQGMVNEREKHKKQMNILMDLLKIPIEERNFEVLRGKIENMIEENDNMKSKNENGQDMARQKSPMELFAIHQRATEDMWNNLPAEIWKQIFEQFSSLKDFKNCYFTCQTWQSIIKTHFKSRYINVNFFEAEENNFKFFCLHEK